MQFDLNRMAATDIYELLLGSVVPRPIALITTLSATGLLNAAPYSLFNVMGTDPAIVAFAVLPHADARLKDTACNILETKEFVVSLVSEEIAEAMNVTCIDAPPGTNELELAGLEIAASIQIEPPRIAASPIAFECCFHSSISFGSNQAIILGKVTNAYVDDQFVVDATRGLIDTPKLNLIGGMHGAKWYTRTADLFEMQRPTWAQWVSEGLIP
jgi:flavin reductase (DIM6/NTAB) family NADH-FMN oxidoreductase RutF